MDAVGKALLNGVEGSEDGAWGVRIDPDPGTT